MAPAALLIIPLRGGQRGEERERPDAPGPGDRHQEHQANPAQPTGLDEVLMTGADRVPIDPFGGDPLAAPPLDGLVDADQQRPGRHEGRDQQAKQDATGGEAGPLRAVQHAVIPFKAPGVGEAQHPQRRGDGPFAGCEERPHEEHERGRPDAAAEQWRERRQQS